jgi:transposase
VYHRLLAQGEPVPRAYKGIINEFRIARVLGETGPISDFSHKRSILRYAGLNLRERKSGKYVGKVKLSKKGRSPMRNVLCQAVFPLVRKGQLFGDYYHQKKAAGMPGNKAMVAVMRKFLVIFYTLSRERVEFCPERVFQCQSQYKMAS